VLSFPLNKQRIMIQVNIDAAFQITYTAAKALRKMGKKGTIVHIGSMAAHFLYPRFALYAASKRCIEDLCLSLDEELRCFGIRVLVSIPGRFASPFLAKTGRNLSRNSWSMISLDKVTTLILRQVQQQKPRMVIDFRYKMLYLFSLLVPKRFLSKYL
jgi:short-subunit dehydrogenase